MKIFINSFIVINCAFVFLGCKNNVASHNPKVQAYQAPKEQVDAPPREPNILDENKNLTETPVVTNKADKGLTFDYLNSLIYLSTDQTTKSLKKYDLNWFYLGKSAKSNGDVWENKMYNRAILKMSKNEIAYLDYSGLNMDNYNLLIKMNAFQNEDKKLGVSYFNYKDRFVQWRKTDDNGTMRNIIDMEGY